MDITIDMAFPVKIEIEVSSLEEYQELMDFVEGHKTPANAIDNPLPVQKSSPVEADSSYGTAYDRVRGYFCARPGKDVHLKDLVNKLQVSHKTVSLRTQMLIAEKLVVNVGHKRTGKYKWVGGED